MTKKAVGMLLALVMAVSGMPSFAFSGATNLVVGQEEVVYAANSFDPILAAGTETDVESASIEETGGFSWDEYVLTQGGELAMSETESVPENTEMVDFYSIRRDSAGPRVRPGGFQAAAAGNVVRYNVLLFDVSTSMRGTPLAVAKQAANKFIDQVLAANGENYVALVQFSSNASVVRNFSREPDAL